MATSTIFEVIRITDPQKAEAFANALQENAQNPKPSVIGASITRNPERIKEIMGKRKP